MFVNKKYKDHESNRVEELMTNVIIAVLAASLLVLSVLYIWPSDVMTSAYFFDHSLRLQPITTDVPTVPISQYSIFLDATFEALIFGITLSGIQILFLYKSVVSGRWSPNYETTLQFVLGWLKTMFTGKRWNEKINTEKLTYFSVFFIAMIIDVATDSLYRSMWGTFGFWHFMGALFVSVTYYNLLSEYLMVKMCVFVVNYGANTVYILLGLVSSDLQEWLRDKVLHSNIDIGAPTASTNGSSSNGNSKQTQSNSRKKRRGRDGKERVPHSGGVHAHQQRNRENSDLPEEFLRMMEDSR
jgi:hypothetical protein